MQPFLFKERYNMYELSSFHNDGNLGFVEGELLFIGRHEIPYFLVRCYLTDSTVACIAEEEQLKGLPDLIGREILVEGYVECSSSSGIPVKVYNIKSIRLVEKKNGDYKKSTWCFKIGRRRNTIRLGHGKA